MRRALAPFDFIEILWDEIPARNWRREAYKRLLVYNNYSGLEACDCAIWFNAKWGIYNKDTSLRFAMHGINMKQILLLLCFWA